jgi:hypothetical protein
MCCERCNAPLVVIQVALTGAEGQMHSCSACDARTWLMAGRRADLDEVLGAVPTKRRAA